ncbi:MAG TPA: DEAD/DEAH box helicase [Myxococcales bacterium]|nr:DEAD/DEAH box helicase [Myxococcales bacterium]
MLAVSETELQTMFDESTFRRGRSYARAGAVGELRVDGERVRARVQGSRPRPYEVWVRRDDGRIVSQCSCTSWAGARRHCKHVAALLYTLRDENAAPSAAAEGAAAPLPSPSVWLAGEESGRTAVPLYYVFTVEGGNAVVRQLRRDRGEAPDAAAVEAMPAADRRIAEMLSLHERDRSGARIPLERAGDVLGALRGMEVYADDRQEIPLGFSEEPLSLHIQGSTIPDGASGCRFRAVFVPRGGDRALSPARVRLLGGLERFALADDRAYPLDPRLSDAALQRFLRHPEVECRAADLPRAFADWLPHLADRCGAVVPSAAELLPVLAGVPRLALTCGGDLSGAEVHLRALYGDDGTAAVELDGRPPPAVPEVHLGADGRAYALQRDETTESAAFAALVAAGLEWRDGAFRAEGDRALRFWSEGLLSLPAAWQRHLPPHLTGLRVRSEPIRASLHIGLSARGWFEVDVRLGTAEQEVDPAELRACLAAGLAHATLRDGSVAPIDVELCRGVLEALADVEPLAEGRGGEVPPWLAGPLQELVRAAGLEARLDPAAAGQLRRLTGDELPRVSPPADLKGDLRPYQAAGFAWLCTLADAGLSALLADEMGLGKTIQALALLLRQRERGERRPALVVSPTSVLPNWIREAERFAPSLRAVAFSGGKRKLPGPEDADLIVTSYALLRRDASLLAAREWSAVILDEAQHVKNPAAATAQAARQLKGAFRLVLTGTPVENRPLDLWSLFEFLLPGLLGSQEQFRKRYEAPVGPALEQAQRKLAIRVRPFLKRRLKRDVLTELPDKQESEVVCELSEPQRRLYRQMLEEVRRDVFGAIEKQGVARSQVNILAGLLRLRQVACDPRLLKLDKSFGEEESAKLMLWRELLDEALDGGHRVICFSQFVEMLSLMRAMLDRDKIPYEYLDGRTRDRQAVIDRFNGVAAPPSAQLFLISLRAGGTGVNLATADTVFLYDPWWNPAVEDQAVDRVHRIGQAKEVSVYRLVARGTVEEKILDLKQRKRDMSGRLLSAEGGSGAFTAAEVEELLRAG